MAITGLYHINITAPDDLMEKTKSFYVDVLGLIDGPRPKVDRRGYWLYAGDNAIVHLAVPKPDDRRNKGSHFDHGYFDHVALSCAGLPAMLGNLEQKKVPYRINVLSGEFAQVQVVAKDPAGTVIELNFQNEPLPPAYQSAATMTA